MARWEEVLDLQLDVHNWLTSPLGLSFGGGYFSSAYSAPAWEQEGSPDWKSEQEAEQRGRQWAQAIGVGVFNAEPIWIDPDMMSVVEAAINRFTPEPLIETDLITQSGFLVLPRSLWLTDPSGKELSWKAAFWSPRSNGIHLVLFHDTHDRDDVDLTDEEMRTLGKAFTTRFLPTHVVNWDFGSYHPGYDPVGGGTDVPAALTVDAHAQLQGTWRLLTQYLAVRTSQRVPRAFAKRARVNRMPTEHVTIVRLRRPPQDANPSEPGLVNWTHRWLVGGHWRNQWYSSVGLHRQIWVSPYVKGPQELPLIVNKARVFELVR
jgi:hypothetical protein